MPECKCELKVCISGCVKVAVSFLFVFLPDQCNWLYSRELPSNRLHCCPSLPASLHPTSPFFHFAPNQSIARSSQAIRWMPFTRLPSPTPLCPTDFFFCMFVFGLITQEGVTVKGYATPWKTPQKTRKSRPSRPREGRAGCGHGTGRTCTLTSTVVCLLQ